MKRLDYIILFGLSLVILLSVAMLQPVPGYMDADYYYAGGLNILNGRGLFDNFLWNYLDDPLGLPHPSHTYWMPLPSLIASIGMVIGGKSDYLSARMLFFLLASLLPPLTSWLSFRLTQKRVSGWIAGGLALCSGFYLVFLGLVETFALTMLGSSLFLVAAYSQLRLWIKCCLLGALAGFLHLTRADGILWLIFALFVLGREIKRDGKRLPAHVLSLFLALLGSYLLVTAFWYIRNLGVFGSLFPPGNSRALWISDYDQLFAFPADNLNFQNWWQAGLGRILAVRWDALLQNFQTLFAVQGQVFLLPLAIIGAWRLRALKVVRATLSVWAIFFLLMTFVFPLAGSRGGFFHSGAAVQPLIWALCPVGLEALIEIGIRKRRWKMERALRGFGLMAVVLAALISIILVVVRIVGLESELPAWRQSWDAYQRVDQTLVEIGVEKDAIVMVNNPPGYFIANQRRAIVIPNGDELVVKAAAKSYGANYLILEKNTVKVLTSLYDNPQDRPGLIYLKTVSDIHIYRIEP